MYKYRYRKYIVQLFNSALYVRNMLHQRLIYNIHKRRNVKKNKNWAGFLKLYFPYFYIYRCIFVIYSILFWPIKEFSDFIQTRFQTHWPCKSLCKYKMLTITISTSFISMVGSINNWYPDSNLTEMYYNGGILHPKN